MTIPDMKCDAEKVAMSGISPVDGQPIDDPHPRTIERQRWLRAGRHPLKISIARRFMKHNFDTVDFAFHYKGPDTSPVKKVLGIRMANCT